MLQAYLDILLKFIFPK